ncbi:hypothetical protein FRB98_005429 [Tulasnella sp. 332]|nr:hypothetical protein FRB98_005429 [Tulasnella sp. 332]
MPPYCKQCHKKNFATTGMTYLSPKMSYFQLMTSFVDLRHANLPQASSPASPSRTQPSTTPASPKLPTSPAKLDLASLASLKRDLAQDTPAEPPSRPLTYTPVDVPEAILEAEEGANADEKDRPDMDTEVESLNQPVAPPTPPRRISIYSRQPMSPVYSPNQDRSKSPPASRSPISPRELSRRPPAAGAWETSSSQSSDAPKIDDITTADDNDPKPLSPAATGFAKRIVPMSTGGQTVAIPGAYSPKRMTQTFTGNSDSNGSPNRIRPNYTGQGGSTGPFANANSPKRVTPNFTGGSWSPSGSAAQRVECPRCLKAVYHAEQVGSWLAF